MSKRCTMPVGDALDKWSILLLKLKYAQEDVVDGKRWDGQVIDIPALEREIQTLQAELERLGLPVQLLLHTMRLAQANAMIWQSERHLRTGDLKSIDLAKAGLESIRIRQENAVRTSAKNNLTQIIGDL